MWKILHCNNCKSYTRELSEMYGKWCFFRVSCLGMVLMSVCFLFVFTGHPSIFNHVVVHNRVWSWYGFFYRIFLCGFYLVILEMFLLVTCWLCIWHENFNLTLLCQCFYPSNLKLDSVFWFVWNLHSCLAATDHFWIESSIM